MVAKPPSPSELETYYSRMIDALRALRSQRAVVVEDKGSSFYKLDEAAFAIALQELRDELDQQVVLMLVASAEALIRQDYEARLEDPAKQIVARRFRILNKKYGDRLPLEEILDVWKEEAKVPDQAGAVKQLYNRWHWLAHGRHFVDSRSGVQPDPRSAIRVIETLIAAIRQTHPDFPRR